MEFLIGIVVLLFGGLVFYKRKADQSETTARLGEIKGQDKQLEIRQDEVEEAVKAIDSGIEQMKLEQRLKREQQRNMTLTERADQIKKGLK